MQVNFLAGSSTKVSGEIRRKPGFPIDFGWGSKMQAGRQTSGWYWWGREQEGILRACARGTMWIGYTRPWEGMWDMWHGLRRMHVVAKGCARGGTACVKCMSNQCSTRNWGRLCGWGTLISAIWDLPASFPIDFLGKLVEKAVNGYHIVAEQCTWA